MPMKLKYAHEVKICPWSQNMPMKSKYAPKVLTRYPFESKYEPSRNIESKHYSEENLLTRQLFHDCLIYPGVITQQIQLERPE